MKGKVTLKATLYQMNFPLDELPYINRTAPSRTRATATTWLISTSVFA